MHQKGTEPPGCTDSATVCRSLDFIVQAFNYVCIYSRVCFVTCGGLAILKWMTSNSHRENNRAREDSRLSDGGMAVYCLDSMRLQKALPAYNVCETRAFLPTCSLITGIRRRSKCWPHSHNKLCKVRCILELGAACSTHAASRETGLLLARGQPHRA